jgi:hypothetical protein
VGARFEEIGDGRAGFKDLLEAVEDQEKLPVCQKGL